MYGLKRAMVRPGKRKEEAMIDNILDAEGEMDKIDEKLFFVADSLQHEGESEEVGEDPEVTIWDLRVNLRGAANILKDAAINLNEVTNWFTDNLTADNLKKAPATPDKAETGASE
jgi:hypothetical protein